MLADAHGTVVAPRRAGVQPAAPPPEGHRGGAVGAARRGDRGSGSAPPPARPRGASATPAPAPSSSSCRRDAPDEFFFLEMNTRLQVEHPVTELVTGARPRGAAAAGRGRRAARARRDPARTATPWRRGSTPRTRRAGFLPTGGRVLGVVLPAGEGVRVDGALVAGLEITSDYDPMLAKVDRLGAGPGRGASPGCAGRSARPWCRASARTSRSSPRCSTTRTCAPGGSTRA